MPRRTSLRILLALSLSATVTPVLSVTGAAASPDTGSPLSWGPCPVGSGADAPAECADITVPRDYSSPDSATISLTMSRIRATGERRGVIAGNPGGPGADALGMFNQVMLPDDVREHYDLLAVEPRGLTWGTPLDCPVPDLPVITAGDIYAGCESTNPGYASTVTTDNTARDLDEARKALGEDRLNLYGVSYGGALMSTYATLFADHTDRLLLDSSASPDQRWFGLGAARKQAKVDGLNAMFSWLADHDDEYHLGTTPLQVYRRWADVVSGPASVQLPTEPPAARNADVPGGLSTLPGELGTQLTDSVVRAQWRAGTLVDSARTWLGDTVAAIGVNNGFISLFDSLYDQNLWPVVGEVLRDAGEETDDEMSPETVPGEEERAASAMMSQQMLYVDRAVICNENTVAPDTSLLPRVLETQFTGGDLIRMNEDQLASGSVCAGWPVPVAPTTVSGAGLQRAPLNIGYSHDTAVTPAGAVDMHRDMGGRLVLVEGYSHAVLVHDPDKVADEISAYFA